LPGDYLREQLTSQHPQRMRKMLEFPLLFGGNEQEVRYAATLSRTRRPSGACGTTGFPS
jgi:hypothetical protein